MLVLAAVLVLVAGIAAGFAVTGRPLPFLADTTTVPEIDPPSTTSDLMSATNPTTTTPTNTTRPPTTLEAVTDALTAFGWYLDPDAVVSSRVLSDAVATMRDQGELFSVAVFATEPEGGAMAFADTVQARLGQGLLLVVTPDTVGMTGQATRYADTELAAALDAAMTSASDAEIISTFVDTLTGSDPNTSTTVPGDLGLAVPMARPECDGRYVAFLGASVEPDAYVREITDYLDDNPGSNYLRTDETCSSLRSRTEEGQVIYAVYFGPFDTFAEACDVAESGPSGTYVKSLDNVSDPNVVPRC